MDLARAMAEAEEWDEEDVGGRKRKKSKGVVADLIWGVKAIAMTFVLLIAFRVVFNLAIPNMMGFSEKDKADISALSSPVEMWRAYQDAIDHKNGIYRGSVTITSEDGTSVRFDTVNGEVVKVTKNGRKMPVETSTPPRIISDDDDSGDTEREDKTVSGVMVQDDAQRILKEWGLVK